MLREDPREGEVVGRAVFVTLKDVHLAAALIELLDRYPQLGQPEPHGEGLVKRAARLVLAIAIASLPGGCAGRTLVVPPSAVRQLNDPAWKVSSEPR